MRYADQKRIWRAIMIAIPIAASLLASKFIASVFSPVLGTASGASVAFLDVGQGDAVLIRTPDGKNILIDGGPDNLVLERIGKLLPYFSRRIDLVVVSHYHDDHIGGLDEVIKRYDVGALIYQADGESNLSFASLLAAAGARKVEEVALRKKIEINLAADCRLLIFNPLSLDVPEDGNNSLLAKLDCAGKRFLFSGDNGLAVEKALLAADIDLAADVLKASHHGSKTSDSSSFLEAVGADFFVVSAGKENRFGHPSQDTLDRAKEQKMIIKRTDISGNIIFSL